MDEFVGRVKEMCEVEGITREELASFTRMTYSRWHNLMNGRGTIRSHEIKAVGLAYPQYSYWLIYDTEMPSWTQICPETKIEIKDWWNDLIERAIEKAGDTDALVREVALMLDTEREYSEKNSEPNIKSWIEGKGRIPTYIYVCCWDYCQKHGWKPTSNEKFYIQNVHLVTDMGSARKQENRLHKSPKS